MTKEAPAPREEGNSTTTKPATTMTISRRIQQPPTQGWQTIGRGPCSRSGRPPTPDRPRRRCKAAPARPKPTPMPQDLDAAGGRGRPQDAPPKPNAKPATASHGLRRASSPLELRADFLAALEVSCLHGALPLADLRVVCFIRANSSGGDLLELSGFGGDCQELSPLHEHRARRPRARRA
jgi:hypothetical protein